MEDFPRTPSPVYNQSQLNRDANAEDSIDLDVHTVPSSVSYMHVTNLSESATKIFPRIQHSGGNNRPSEDQTYSKDNRLKDNVSTNEFMHTEKQKSRAYKAEARRHKLEEQYYVRNKLNQSFTNGFAYQILRAVAQVIPHGINNSQSYFGSPAHCHAQFSLGIPSISYPGLTGSLYASPAAFMTPGDPFYPDMI
ncbi:hypothetical protein PIB30_012675 [Stylosanthes scabra]|uniref:Uncharacterized protein n=1 Tax=Stylosanthes scabra TaxID=79078 RepID=A0ABU6Q6V9_9FABA|nr:hypothetical protein [Stylosanthes scabra]